MGSYVPEGTGDGALRFIAGWQQDSRKRLEALEVRHSLRCSVKMTGSMTGAVYQTVELALPG